MTSITLRKVAAFPDPDHSALAAEAFSDYAQCALLSDVLDKESASWDGLQNATVVNELRLAAFRGEELVGWSYSQLGMGRTLHMVNSGVAVSERRIGIYSRLVLQTIEHAKSEGHVSIISRHAAGNNAVIIAKLKLGFVVSGFEYSEVYGPVVRLTHLVHEKRRELYNLRSRPIRRAERSK